MIHIHSGHGPGVIGVPTLAGSRYGEFNIALSDTLAPIGTEEGWITGLNVAHSWNLLVQEILKESHMEWLWCLNDDHAWEPNTLMRLLDHRVDVVVPLVANRHAPLPPVIFHGPRDAQRLYTWDELSEHKGLHQLDAHDSVGHAGMLIRRSVFEKIPPKWFEVGKIESDCSTLDLWFCWKLQDAGIPIHLDVDVTLDHLAPFRIVVKRNAEGKFKPTLSPLTYSGV